MPQSAIVASPKIPDKSKSQAKPQLLAKWNRLEWSKKSGLMWSMTGKTSKKIQFLLFLFFKWVGLVLFEVHSIFIHQRNIPSTFCSTMIIQVQCPWMTLIKLNWCHNPAVQLIILCIIILSNPTSPRTWSLLPFMVLLYCLKARGRSKWIK